MSKALCDSVWRKIGWQHPVVNIGLHRFRKWASVYSIFIQVMFLLSVKMWTFSSCQTLTDREMSGRASASVIQRQLWMAGRDIIAWTVRCCCFLNPLTHNITVQNMQKRLILHMWSHISLCSCLKWLKVGRWWTFEVKILSACIYFGGKGNNSNSWTLNESKLKFCSVYGGPINANDAPRLETPQKKEHYEEYYASAFQYRPACGWKNIMSVWFAWTLGIFISLTRHALRRDTKENEKRVLLGRFFTHKINL